MRRRLKEGETIPAAYHYSMHPDSAACSGYSGFVYSQGYPAPLYIEEPGPLDLATEIEALKTKVDEIIKHLDYNAYHHSREATWPVDVPRPFYPGPPRD